MPASPTSKEAAQRSRFDWRVLAFLILISSARGSAAEESTATLRGRATIKFQGTSTLHSFSGSGKASEFLLRPTLDRKWTADVELPVNSLDTGNDWRDGDMREMFRAAECPTIRAHFEGIDPEGARRNARMPFELTICKTTQPMVAKLRGWQQDADSVTFEADFDVSLRAFGLEAPRTLLLSVDDTVHVTATANVRRE